MAEVHTSYFIPHTSYFQAPIPTPISSPYGEAGRGLLLQAVNGIRVLDNLDSVDLLAALGNEVEIGLAAKILESFARTPSRIHFLDVSSGEIFGGDSAFGLEFYVEISEVTEFYLVASEELLADTCHGIGQNALDTTLGEGAVVVGDVLTEIIEREDFVNLSASVSLGFGDVGFQGSGLRAHNGNRIVDHIRPLPTSP